MEFRIVSQQHSNQLGSAGAGSWFIRWSPLVKTMSLNFSQTDVKQTQPKLTAIDAKNVPNVFGRDYTNLALNHANLGLKKPTPQIIDVTWISKDNNAHQLFSHGFLRHPWFG